MTNLSQQGEFARGWKVLLAAFLGMGVCIVSLSYYSSGIWIKPWQEEFGWSRTEIGTAQTLSTLVLVLTAPLAGKLIDRFGLRLVSSISLILYGISLYAISKMNGELWILYLLFILMTLVAVASSPLAFTRAVNAWFHKHKGLALGISLTSTGVAAFLIPKYLTPYVAEHGWRAGFFILIAILFAVVPIVWLLIRDNPPEIDEEESAEPTALTGATFQEATKSRTFWQIAILFLLIAIAVVGLIPSFIPLLQDAGLSAAEAGGYAAILGASVMLGRLLTGFLIDRFFAPYVTAGVFSLVALGCLALGIGGIQYALVAAIALGFAIGAEVDLIGYFTAKYFGLKNYGTIYGFQYSTFNFGAAVSPVLAGFIWDTTGNYDMALIGAALLIGIAIIIALFLPKFPASQIELKHK